MTNFYKALFWVYQAHSYVSQQISGSQRPWKELAPLHRWRDWGPEYSWKWLVPKSRSWGLNSALLTSNPMSFPLKTRFTILWAQSQNDVHLLALTVQFKFVTWLQEAVAPGQALTFDVSSTGIQIKALKKKKKRGLELLFILVLV